MELANRVGRNAEKIAWAHSLRVLLNCSTPIPSFRGAELLMVSVSVEGKAGEAFGCTLDEGLATAKALSGKPGCLSSSTASPNGVCSS